MKKIFLAMAIAFAITTAMTITTVIAHTDQCLPLGNMRAVRQKGHKVT